MHPMALLVLWTAASADVGGVVGLELLRPPEVDVSAVQPAVETSAVATLRDAEAALEASRRTAAARQQDLRRLSRVMVLSARLADTEVRARRVELTAAHQGERVQRLAGPPPEDAATYQVDASKEALDEARARAELAHAEVELLRDHAAHARSVRALERVRLAEVRARGASPPTPPDALLRRQAVRVRLEAAEARRRARVLVAQAHTRAAAEALSSER
jgi:hypothetical protein